MSVFKYTTAVILCQETLEFISKKLYISFDLTVLSNRGAPIIRPAGQNYIVFVKVSQIDVEQLFVFVILHLRTVQVVGKGYKQSGVGGLGSW